MKTTVLVRLLAAFCLISALGAVMAGCADKPAATPTPAAGGGPQPRAASMAPQGGAPAQPGQAAPGGKAMQPTN